MELQEQSLLEEIKDLYHKLEDNVYGVYMGITKIGEPGFGYEGHVNELFKKVHKLYIDFHPDYLSEFDVKALMHTIDKEVKDVEYYYQTALKPKASRKQKEKVCAAIHKANEHIKLDLLSLFAKIDDLQ